MHGQLQHPAARLAERPPRSSVAPLEPFTNKVFKSRRQGPGKRSLPGRPTEASQGTCRDAPRVPARPGERQASGRDKTTTAASGHSVPTLQRIHQRVALGAFPGTRGGRLCSQRKAVAFDADKIAIVAGGGTPDGPFLHCLGDTDGHLMPLSPAVRVR